MHGELSPKTRRLRLEALAHALRRFKLTDDGNLSELVCLPDLPSERRLLQAIKESDQRIPPGVSLAFIARTVLVHIAGKEKRVATFEDPFAVAPKTGPLTQQTLDAAVNKILAEYKRAVEERRGYTLLWNGDEPKDEKSAQALFELAVRGWCDSLGLDLQAEVNLGRGPVDFRLSNGPQVKTVVEMKLANHNTFWAGLTKQLPRYMTVDGVRAGYFVTVVFDEADARRIERIEKVIQSVRERVDYTITSIIVDARKGNKPSASKER